MSEQVGLHTLFKIVVESTKKLLCELGQFCNEALLLGLAPNSTVCWLRRSLVRSLAGPRPLQIAIAASRFTLLIALVLVHLILASLRRVVPSHHLLCNNRKIAIVVAHHHVFGSHPLDTRPQHVTSVCHAWPFFRGSATFRTRPADFVRD